MRATIRQAAEAQGGTIDVLANTAANDQRHSFDEVDDIFWERMIAINLKAYFFAGQEAARWMPDGGAIVNSSTIGYMMGNSGYPVHTTANAGITGMTRNLASELGPRGIRVNALAPGWVLTRKQLDTWATPDDLVAHLARQCLKTHLVPEDMVAPPLFPASCAAMDRLIRSYTESGAHVSETGRIRGIDT